MDLIPMPKSRYVCMLNFNKKSQLQHQLDIASRCCVSPDGTWLKRDIQSIMVDTNIPLWGGGLSVYGSNLY